MSTRLGEVWRRCYQLESKQWLAQELTGEEIYEASENRLPELQAAQRTKKDNFETTAEWFQANNKRQGAQGPRFQSMIFNDFG